MLRCGIGVSIAAAIAWAFFHAQLWPSRVHVALFIPIAGAALALWMCRGQHGVTELLGLAPASSNERSDAAGSMISGAWWGVLPGIVLTLGSVPHPAWADFAIGNDLLIELLEPCQIALLLSAMVLPHRWSHRHA